MHVSRVVAPRYSCSCIRGILVVHPASQPYPKRHPLKPKPRAQRHFVENKKRKPRHKKMAAKSFLLPPPPPRRRRGSVYPPRIASHPRSDAGSPTERVLPTPLAKKGVSEATQARLVALSMCVLLFEKKKETKKRSERVIQASPRRITLGRISFRDSSGGGWYPWHVCQGSWLLLLIQRPIAGHLREITSRR